MSASDPPTSVDVLRYETPDGPSYRTVEAGHGQEVVAAHEDEHRRRTRLRWAIAVVIAGATVGYGAFVGRLLLGVVAGAVVLGAFYVGGNDADVVPAVVERNVRPERAAERYDLDVRARDVE